MASKTEDSVSVDNAPDGSVDKEILSLSGSNNSNHRVPPYIYNGGSEQVRENLEHDNLNHFRPTSEDQLGPLPHNWEKAYTETGEVYFIDHNTGTSHWLDPRLSKFQKRSLEECLDDELPYGWEKIDDQLYGTYFIDHVNRRTQYENPVLQAKRAQQILTERKSPNFTRNPKKLKGQRIQTTLIKSSRGLGFTIVGGDDTVEEFLQIKSVVPNGPAWLDGKLQTGDVLVYVNNTCVLGFTHNEMVNVFKSIASSETVTLEVCRGYPLPFDPNDPNTEVVTTIAVNAPDMMPDDPSIYLELDPNMQNDNRFGFLDSSFLPVHGLQNGENLATASVNSMPDLCISDKINTIKRPNSTDILLSDSTDYNDRKESPPPSKSEFLSIPVIKGNQGFGFTIADSSHGQKVKKILDRNRCKNLLEGDILVNINDVKVRNMCHTEVVQVLKECPRNQEALIQVQRGKSNDKKDKINQCFFRSKTPTADIYSTQAKTVVPSRPKTPLIDTRNRTKSPVVDVNRPEWRTNTADINSMDDRCKYTEYSTHDVYYTDPYKDNMVGNLADNFGQMVNMDDEPMRHIKREWRVNDKMSLPNEMYNMESSLHSPTMKQNGSIHQDYYKDIYGARMHPQYVVQDYNNYSIGQEQNVDTGEIWDKRKETTSFEHEQPRSSSVARYHPQYGNEMVCPTIPDVEWIETLVTLVRQDSGFGFRIVGGTEEHSQVSVGHIVPGGVADIDNRLNQGDLIMSVDGESVMNSSHHHVVQLMIAAARNGRVTLGIRRRINAQDLQPSYDSGRPMNMQYPYDVAVTRMENEGFGFVIISSVNKAGSTIGRIIEGSPAERCGRLEVGDHILAVNHVDITNLCHKDIDESTGDGDGQYHAVELTRGTRGFGFSIRGGREFQNMPLFVLQIADNGPAAIDNRLRVGDQIIEINGINTKNMTHAEAIEIIRNGGPSVRLLVRRGCQMPSANSVTFDEISNQVIDDDDTLRNSEIIYHTKRTKKRKFFIPLCCCSSRKRQ
ncbi:Similar to MAGI2: Membrane-associated guanylate kinase [Cotesia congregata]|uniref:WW and PDZ domain-containing protein 2 (Homo sapiens) n=1 Tax=Cotesia congregata TaxID=51543 RepID=A0A8J2HLU5_COTCN|nr:Similar to MAGI2: Membrane-associated guanylate kinase [Cotesia congregata]